MNVDYRQNTCPECDKTPDDVELSEPKALYYGDDVIVVQDVVLYCTRDDSYLVLYSSD